MKPKKIFLLKSFLYFLLLISNHPIFPQNYSPNGKIFTPKGDLRALIIYAGFSGYDNHQPLGSWPDSSEFPLFRPLEITYSELSQFTSHFNDSLPNNISKFYYENSNGKFRITADVLSKRININPTGLNGWSSFNRAVINKMQEEFPDFDWSKYDNRTNLSLYTKDNSQSIPDHKPDYIIIAYRYSDKWSIQPQPGMNHWTGSAGGFSQASGLGGIKYNNYTFDDSGFTACFFGGDPDHLRRTFIHELAHELYSCPHYGGCNGTIGNYFYKTGFDYGMMQWGGGVSITAANGWERWILGWINIKHDLSNYEQNGIYTLKDYITTGDAIRIKIPNTEEQYLWVENHQKISSYDHSPWARKLKNDPIGSDGIPDIERGVYMYIENILSDRSKINSGIIYDLNKVNGIKNINASGNFDYSKPTQFTINGWNTKLYHYQQGLPNPISGTNPHFAFRHDFDNNGYIHDTTDFNKSKTESFPIDCEIINDTPQFFYGHWGGRNQNAIDAGKRSDAFQVGDTISIGSNPPIVNYPKYISKKNRLEPIYLNGLYIRIISILNGEMKLEVKFNETDIKKNVRWCGELILSDVPGVATNYDLNIKQGTTLTLNKSGIPNRLTLLNGDFINPTSFTISNGAYMHLEPSSQVMIDESTFTVELGGTLELGNKSIIKAINNSEIYIKSGGTLILQEKSKIKSKNSKITIEPGASVVIKDKKAKIKIGDKLYRAQ